MTHINFEEFENKQKEFIVLVKDSFNHIARQYNIELPLSEIAYIFDYVNNDQNISDLEEGDF